VVVLAIGLALGAAVVLALTPGATRPVCPDPNIPCGAPPVVPTLPPVANASPSPAPTPASTIVRPSGSLVISSARPSAAPSVQPTATTSGSPGPSTPPSAAPSPQPTAPPVANLPQPRPASNAEPLRAGTVWTSDALGFQLEYDDELWSVDEEAANGIALSAGRGAVSVLIEGFKASSSPKSLIQQKVRSLSDTVLGLTEETDPTRQLPGEPVVGHRQGFGTVLNGTINTPQGPSANVDVVILAASDSQISIRVTILTDDDLREPAFSVADSILNSIEWPADTQ
jgi:hypothetical protein